MPGYGTEGIAALGSDGEFGMRCVVERFSESGFVSSRCGTEGSHRYLFML